MFRRRRTTEDGAFETDEGPDEPTEPTEPTELPSPPPRPQGPWDEDDAPADEVTRVDLGGLRVPVDGTRELRVDVDPESGQVVSVTLATPTSLMQVGAFAAPRSSGIWAEVRAEIADSLGAGGGHAQEVTGPYGTELHAQVPTDVAGQLAPTRFVGVDGPRWFVRGMIQGLAATDPAADTGLLEVFGQLVVCRGGEAMAVRDPLPLRLPEGIETLPEPAEKEPAPDLSLLERGPEITETR